MSDSPLASFLARVRSRLAPLPLQVLDGDPGIDWMGRAPGQYGDDVSVARDSQRTTATLENDLTLTVFSALTLTLRLTGLVRRSDGETIPIGPSGAGFTVAVIGDRVARSVTFPRGSGVEVVGLSVVGVAGSVVGGGTVPIGATWAIVQQSRTLADQTQTITSTLLSGPVSLTQALGWPGSAVIASTSVAYTRLIDGAVVGPNVAVAISVPTGARWELQSLFAPFSNGPAATFNQLMLLDSGGTKTRCFSPTSINVPGGTLVYHIWGVGLSMLQRSDGLAFTMPWPAGLIMNSGDLLSTLSQTGVFQWNQSYWSVLERLDP